LGEAPRVCGEGPNSGAAVGQDVFHVSRIDLKKRIQGKKRGGGGWGKEEGCRCADLGRREKKARLDTKRRPM